MGPIRVLTCTRLFCVTFLMVAGMAHELGAVPLFGVFAEKHIEVLYLFFAQVKPLAHLTQVVVLHLPNTVFLMF